MGFSDLSTEPNSAPELGRILFERRGKPLVPLLGTLFSAFLVVVTVSAKQPWAMVVVFAVDLFFIVQLVISLTSSFRCHESGVQSRSLFGTRTLKYSDVESFTFEATDIYKWNTRIGSRLKIRFVPTRQSGLSPIGYVSLVRSEDVDLDALRDRIAGVIAKRMAAELAERKSVQWSAYLRLTSMGIEYQPGGVFGRRSPVLLHFEDYGGHVIKEGLFRLFAKDQTEEVAVESVALPNFFPGYLLFLSLVSGKGL